MATVIVLMAKTLVNSRIAAQQSTAANRATNGTGPGEHRLYDMVSHIREEISVLTEAQADFHRRGWRNLPDDLNDATKLTLKLRGLEASELADKEAHAAILADLQKLHEAIEQLDRSNHNDRTNPS